MPFSPSSRNLQRDVVVTGVGAVSAHGIGADLLFDNLKFGQTLIADNPKFIDLGFDVAASAWIDESVLTQVDALNGERDADWGVHTRIALASAIQAWGNARMDEHDVDDKNRGAVFFASNRQLFNIEDLCLAVGAIDRDRIDFDRFVDAIRHGDWSRLYFHRQQDLPALTIASRFGIHGHHGAHGEACASGTIVIGSAAQRIREGEIDFALAGASESTNNLMTMVAFNSIGALASNRDIPTSRLSRPFDRDRCGFVMSEGSAFLMLESAERAAKRGIAPLAKIVGFSSLLESQRITSSDDSGNEYARCIRAALNDARLKPDDIDCINAHGTSTPINDACEAYALKQVFGDRLRSIPVTANKSALGHSLGNSGAIEAVLSIISLRQQTIPPTLNFHVPDKSTAGLQLSATAQTHAMRYVLSNSFGFGGSNACLILEAA